MTERLLPLFPLPLVLFPGVPLPLHIFEPRYREMLADCLAGDRRFGIVFAAEDDPEGPRRGAVGCIAVIQSSETLPDGRSNILVVGGDRFAIARLVAGVRPYLLGEVVTYGDIEEPPEPLGTVARQLRDVFERVGRAARGLRRVSEGPALDEAIVDRCRIELPFRAARIAVDGEIIEAKGPIEYTIWRDALRVVVPRDASLELDSRGR